MRALALAAVGLAALAVQSVSAELPSATFRGIRIEGNAGGDRFHSEGTHNDKFGYGGAIGFDGVIADKIVIGPEATYWRARNGSTNRGTGINGGAVSSDSAAEYGAAVRAGYLITPNLLVFGKGGWVRNDQRARFDATGQLFYVNGQIVGPEQSYFRHEATDGYQVGGGVEYTLPSFGGFALPIYVSAQYVYSDYENHTRRQRLMGGVGIRFK